MRNIMFAEILDRNLMRQMFKYVFECTSWLNRAAHSHQKIAFNGKARLILICRIRIQSTRDFTINQRKKNIQTTE